MNGPILPFFANTRIVGIVFVFSGLFREKVGLEAGVVLFCVGNFLLGAFIWIWKTVHANQIVQLCIWVQSPQD